MSFKLCEDHFYNFDDPYYIDDWIDAKTSRKKNITYLNDIIAFDIESSSFKEYPEEDDYKDDTIYNYLKGKKIKVSKKLYSDIPDLSFIRRQLFGRLFFSETSGTAPDVLYNELAELDPNNFPDEIINPADCLDQILTVFISQLPKKEQPDGDKRAVMYIWQVCINGRVIYGRTWDQFLELTDYLSNEYALGPDRRMVIWVHNLAWEFEFIKDLFEWDKVFAISTRKPIYAVTTSGLEFRCSYILSNLSLANVAKSLTQFKLRKKVGDLDYSKIRHSETPLTKKELGYCCYDVLIVSAYIYECLSHEKRHMISELPLTATGYCRRYCREMCLSGSGRKEEDKQYKEYHSMISRLTISGEAEYKLMLRAFAGGYTHGNVSLVGHILYGGKESKGIASDDLSSAYPGALCSEQFPMSKGEKIVIRSYKELNKNCKLYCCIFDCTFHNLRPKAVPDNYISISKCWHGNYTPDNDKYRESINAVTNNGRLVSADKISISITNVDYEIILKMYEWDRLEIGDFYRYKKSYLPKKLIEAILKLFKNKTELKGVKGQEDFYLKQKQLLNSVYGMMVTSINPPINEYVNGEWTVRSEDLSEMINKYNKSKKRFLFYPWGIFCTAYVRRTILSGILSCGSDYVYSDTDSLKILDAQKHENFISSYNKMVTKKLEIMCDHYGLSQDLIKPKTSKGVTKYLGIFEDETSDGRWLAFKTLGAKRYLLMNKDHELELTVSGLNKKVTTPYLIKKYGKYKALEVFTNDLVIPGEYSGKLTHTYIDDKMEGYITDYLGNTIKYYSPSGIYLEAAEYRFSLESEYLNYIKTKQGELFNL